MKSLAVAATLIAASLSASAAKAAVTFDLAANFGDDAFVYGQVDESLGGAIKAYTPSFTCVLGPSCFRGDTLYKQVGHTPGNGYILAHPGPEWERPEYATLIAFVAPEAGTYQFTGSAYRFDMGDGDGVDISFYNPDGALTAAGSLIGSETLSLSYQFFLAQGEYLGIAIGNRGNDRHDTVALQGAFRQVVSAVPEPGTWALMIAGVGMVGGALRRRASLAPEAAA